MVIGCRVLIERDARIEGVHGSRAVLMQFLKVWSAAPEIQILGVRYERLSIFDLNSKL